GDRDALLALYRSTGGASWARNQGWVSNAPDLGEWYGVESNEEGRVVKLKLTRNNLRGEKVP
ncbi:unnamed protein product, partial [Discosporangium mesarthrocarpum]